MVYLYSKTQHNTTHTRTGTSTHTCTHTHTHARIHTRTCTHTHAHTHTHTHTTQPVYSKQSFHTFPDASKTGHSPAEALIVFLLLQPFHTSFPSLPTHHTQWNTTHTHTHTHTHSSGGVGCKGRAEAFIKQAASHFVW